MSDHPICALCGLKLMGDPTMMEVSGEVRAFCPDAMGCRRRALRQKQNALSTPKV